MDKLLFKNWGFWVIIYSTLTTATIVIMAIVWSNQECPAQELPPITEVSQQQIKQIGNAETKNDVDSLLIKYYGFKSK